MSDGIENKQYETNASIGAAINYAAKSLPEQCYINIEIEKDGYDVNLYFGGEHISSPGCETLTDDILHCVKKAVLNRRFEEA